MDSVGEASPAVQVLFLLYHYFNAREIYNAIRVFIAGYVWMTGYGNFLYYYHYKDFSLGRSELLPCLHHAQYACSPLDSLPGNFPSLGANSMQRSSSSEACAIQRLVD